MTQEFINNLADKLQKVGALHAIGETWISIDSTIPAGGVPFIGQLVNRSVWADLFAWATSQGKVKTESEWQTYASANGGNCPYYSDGDGSTTFRMPCIKSYLKGADTILDAGGYTDEGLPNITGGYRETASIAGDLTNVSGAFAGTNIPKTTSYGGYTGPTYDVETVFDANKSNPIYGNSDHVTPETHSILIGVYAVGIVANIGSADATQFLSGLATVEAKTSAHIRVVETWESDDGLSWYRKWSDGWIEQGGKVNSTSLTFPVSFSNTNYKFFAGSLTNTGDSATWNGIANYHGKQANKKNTGFSSISNYSQDWYACGY